LFGDQALHELRPFLFVGLSQELTLVKQGTHGYGVLDYYRLLEMAQKLGLPTGYEFTQCDDGEDILAANKTTGHEIRWTGQTWVDAHSNASAAQSEACPSCGASGVVRFGEQKRCQQCGKQWPPRSRVQQTLTRRDVLNFEKDVFVKHQWWVRSVEVAA
jgi:hypothetical protein